LSRNPVRAEAKAEMTLLHQIQMGLDLLGEICKRTENENLLRQI
jgi:hypothetical protein